MKPLVIIVIAVLIAGVSITSISAQSQYEIPAWVKGIAGFWAEDKITDSEFGEGLSFLIDNNIITVPKIKQLQDENTRLQSENIKLKTDIIKLKSENSQPKQNPIQSTSKLNSGYPSIDKRYSGIEANDKIKELYNYHNSMTEPQRLVQISKPVPVSEFVLGIVYAGEWNVIYTVSGDRNGPDFGMGSIDGKGVTLVPFDCSHVPNYLQIILLTKIDESGKAYMIIFKNGVAVALDSTDKPYGMFGVGTQCDTGFDANHTYVKTLN